MAQFEHRSARFATGEIEDSVELKISQPFEIESGEGVSDPVVLRRQPAGRYVNVVESSGEKEKLKRINGVASDGSVVDSVHNGGVVTHNSNVLTFP